MTLIRLFERVRNAWANRCWRCLWDPFHGYEEFENDTYAPTRFPERLRGTFRRNADGSEGWYES